MKNTPLRYCNKKDYDVIDIAKDYDLNFNRGNVLKYVIRAGKKDDEIRDLEKAKDYLEREINHLRNELKIELRELD
jgi:hypothetical protein